MSLYIGKDNNSNSIIHITSGKHTEAEMKSGLLPDTILHNDKTFLTFDLYPVSVALQTWLYVYTINGSVDYNFHQLQSSGFALMPGAKLSYYLNSANKIYNLPSDYRFATTYGNFGGTLNRNNLNAGMVAPYLIPCYNVFTTAPDGNTSEIKNVVIMNDRKLINSYGVSIKGSIGGTISEFIVGDLDIASIKYVSEGIICSHPSALDIDGYHQLIDASLIPGSITIDSNVVEGTKIKKGGYTIIDSGSSLLGTGITYSFTVYLPDSTYVYLMDTEYNTLHVVNYNGADYVFDIQTDAEHVLYFSEGVTESSRPTVWYVKVVYKVIAGKVYIRGDYENISPYTRTLIIEVI